LPTPDTYWRRHALCTIRCARHYEPVSVNVRAACCYRNTNINRSSRNANRCKECRAGWRVSSATPVHGRLLYTCVRTNSHSNQEQEWRLTLQPARHSLQRFCKRWQNSVLLWDGGFTLTGSKSAGAATVAGNGGFICLAPAIPLKDCILIALLVTAHPAGTGHL
jgi:hypothetical protein